ncbi:asparagine synthase (glutamine-hydrolyzing) [Pseudomonas sp. LRF_L74]|uniref:asparagine synthase (glutamine-hydrolyzing) n=1 Tax=Pseudomonas sp. LRF_L74 TaxID=3369422 RepID=UPI003F616701
MCGIAGWTDWSRDLGSQHDILQRMTRSLAPRGPDAEGLWTSRHALLGHRRLAIIDLENGVQPMLADAGGRVALTYSGEVYNYRELREELRSLGQVFRTASDTEVVLRAYLQWGEASFARLTGIYAFAVWDERDRSLWLVRDRFGVKPLYYYPTASGVLFGSEPKTVLAHPEVNPVLDASGVAELFALTTAPTPGHGVYKSLYTVRPGQALRFDGQGRRTLTYWQLASQRHTDDAATTAERVASLLQQVVSDQLVADVPLGSLLSGGLDSSAISAYAVRALGDGQRLPTFSLDFPEQAAALRPSAWQSSWDEPYAREMASFLGSAHRTLAASPEAVIEQDDAVLAARDLPGWGELDGALYLLFREVRLYTTVALSGESADEVFGGYPFFHDAVALAHDGFPWLAGRQGVWSLLRPGVAERVDAPAYIDWRYREALAEVPRLDGESQEQARQREVAYLAMTRWLPAMLDRKDRMSMAVGMEVRVPFCDHRLVEYAWNIPWALKSVDGEGKSILRQALRGVLPQSVLTRRKSGFPANPDPRYLQLLRERVGALLATGDSPLFELIDTQRVRQLLEAGQPLPSPRASASPTAGLAYLLNLHRWLERYRVDISL